MIMNEIVIPSTQWVKKALLLSVSLSITLSGMAQEQTSDKSFSFRRSSLYTYNKIG